MFLALFCIKPLLRVFPKNDSHSEHLLCGPQGRPGCSGVQRFERSLNKKWSPLCKASPFIVRNLG